MTQEYMTADDPGAHLDYPEMTTNEHGTAAQPIPAGSVQCPKCKGWGGHNLRLNAYPLHQYANTPANRHLHSHFRCGCDQCSGWGYVAEADSKCVHDYGNRECIGTCLHRETCSKCGKQVTIDTSD